MALVTRLSSTCRTRRSSAYTPTDGDPAEVFSVTRSADASGPTMSSTSATTGSSATSPSARGSERASIRATSSTSPTIERMWSAAAVMCRRAAARRSASRSSVPSSSVNPVIACSGRAQLVTEGRDEVALGAVGRLGRRPGQLGLRPPTPVALGRALAGDVEDVDRQGPRYAGGVHDRRHGHHQVEEPTVGRAGRRLVLLVARADRPRPARDDDVVETASDQSRLAVPPIIARIARLTRVTTPSGVVSAMPTALSSKARRNRSSLAARAPITASWSMATEARWVSRSTRCSSRGDGRWGLAW